MGQRSPQTQAKRARELALKERRERKIAKKADALAQRLEPTSAETDESVESDEPVEAVDPDLPPTEG